MDRLLLGSTAVAAVGLAALAALGHVVEAHPVPLSDLARREGQHVCVRATLVHLRVTASGSQRFALSDGNASLPGWARVPLGATPGDRVQICGTLQRSSGVLEILPRGPQDVRILERWDDRAVAVAVVAAEPWRFLDQNLLLRGTLERDGARTFLSDPNSGARLRASAPPTAPEGEPLTVRGRLGYDPEESTVRLSIESFGPGAGP